MRRLEPEKMTALFAENEPDALDDVAVTTKGGEETDKVTRTKL
jgi:hypothetical protein